MWELDLKEGWVLKKTLERVSWTVRRPNQSILKEVNPEYSLERLMLKLQYFSHLMWRNNSLEKTLMLKIEGRRGNRGEDDWMASLTQWTWLWTNSGRWWRTESWRAAVHGVAKSRIQLSDWKTATIVYPNYRDGMPCVHNSLNLFREILLD